jgi:hypothetical protein
MDAEMIKLLESYRKKYGNVNGPMTLFVTKSKTVAEIKKAMETGKEIFLVPKKPDVIDGLYDFTLK